MYLYAYYYYSIITSNETIVNRLGVEKMGKEALTLTVTECAKLLGIGRNSAYEAVSRGEIPVVKIGRRLLVPRWALEKMLREPGSAKAAP